MNEDLFFLPVSVPLELPGVPGDLGLLVVLVSLALSFEVRRLLKENTRVEPRLMVPDSDFFGVTGASGLVPSVVVLK